MSKPSKKKIKLSEVKANEDTEVSDASSTSLRRSKRNLNNGDGPNRTTTKLGTVSELNVINNKKVIPQSPSKKSEENNDDKFYYKKIENVLSTYYMDVKDRLKLTFEPKCLKNLEHCHHFHSKKSKTPIYTAEYSFRNDIKSLIQENRPQDFLRMTSNMCKSNHFPYQSLIFILEIILTINEPSNNLYKANDIIRTGCFLFENILNKFPPCWHRLRPMYSTLLTESLFMDNFKNEYNPNDGIFKICFQMLYKVLQDTGETLPKKQFNMNDSELDAAPEMANFYWYEEQMKQKYSLEYVSRDDQIKRIFIVIHLLVKLMEWDLAMWIMKSERNIASKMCSGEKSPLIAQVLWPLGEWGHVNALIREIINIFIVCIRIKMPQNNIDILARLMNLITNATNLCEVQSNPPKTLFPNIQILTKDLAKEIWKIIQNNYNSSVDLFLAVLDNIHIPFLRIILIDNFLMKMNFYSMKLSMEKIYHNMLRKHWTKCSSNGQREYFKHELCGPCKNTPTMFPVYEPKKQSLKKANEIFSEDYLQLIFELLKSYISVYRNHEILKTTEPDTVQDLLRKKKLQRESKIAVYGGKKCNFVLLENDIEFLKMNFMKKAKRNIIILIKPNILYPNILVNLEIAKMYREDLKWYFILGDLIRSYHNEYGHIFDDWLIYLPK